LVYDCLLGQHFGLFAVESCDRDVIWDVVRAGEWRKLVL
jgi:hypothetical protein